VVVMRMDKGITKMATAVIIIVIVIVASAAAAYITFQPKPVTREIRIGLVASLTGVSADVGTDMKRASILAVDEINEKGGVYVKEYNAKLKIKLIEGDDRTNPQEGVTCVKKLILEDNVDVLVGGFSSAVTYASQVPAIENKVPFVITGASSSLVTRRTDKDTSYMFHYCTITDDYSTTIVKFFAETMKPKVAPNRNFKLAILYQDSPYGQGCYQSSVDYIKAKNLPMDIVASEKFKMGDMDFHTQLTKIAAAKPDAVYHAGFVADTAEAIKEGLVDIGLKTVYIAVECCEDPNYYGLMEKIGPVVDRQLLESKFGPFAGHYSNAVDAYKEVYTKRWGIAPGMMGADTYDAIYLVALAIENAGTLDKAKVRDAIEKIEMPQKLIMMQGGVVKFDKNHEIAPISFVEQIFYDSKTKKLVPYIIYPDSLKQKDFELPPDYKAGGS